MYITATENSYYPFLIQLTHVVSCPALFLSAALLLFKVKTDFSDGALVTGWVGQSHLYPLFMVVVQAAIKVRRQLGGVYDFRQAL